MAGKHKARRMRNVLIASSVFALVIVLAACAPSGGDSAGSGSSSGSANTPVVKPAENEFGVITAAAWAEAYPHEYETYSANADNHGQGSSIFEPRGDMMTMYPQIMTIWKGNAFTKSYFEPNGHQYTLEDIAASLRPGDATLANCLSCKSADFTAMYQQQGDAIFAQPFAQVLGEIKEPISCYNCHENEPESLAMTQNFYADGMGSDASSIPLESQVCGQCHNEYYFNPETKAVTNPYNSLATMTPEAIYEYYQNISFSDSTHPDSEVGWIKVQHPEFEFVYGGEGSSMSQRSNPATGLQYTCADCHMGNEIEAEDGTTYRSHLLISPLENEELLKSCEIEGCHTDLASQVEDWQKESEDKVNSVADKLVLLTNTIAEKKTTLDAAVLEEVKALNRESQFYWEFVMVENSEGAHNPMLSNDCLDRADELADEALKLLG